MFSGEKPDKPRLKRVKRTYTSGDDGGTRDFQSMFQIRKPVGYEERQHLAWSETDTLLRRLASDAVLDPNEEEVLLYVVKWNLDSLHPYRHMLDDYQDRYDAALREMRVTDKIAGLHQLAEDLMDALGMGLQMGIPTMDGFGEDEDPQEVMRDPLEEH